MELGMEPGELGTVAVGSPVQRAPYRVTQSWVLKSKPGCSRQVPGKG